MCAELKSSVHLGQIKLKKREGDKDRAGREGCVSVCVFSVLVCDAGTFCSL